MAAPNPNRPLAVRIPQAAALSGVPTHVFEKSFMRPGRKSRPRHIPPPPPHFRVGRSIFIYVDGLSAWVESLGKPIPAAPARRGRPTKAEQIARRQRGEG